LDTGGTDAPGKTRKCKKKVIFSDDLETKGRKTFHPDRKWRKGSGGGKEEKQIKGSRKIHKFFGGKRLKAIEKESKRL